MKGPRFDPAPVLRRLKDFQRRTVDAAFQRLYLDPSPTGRFLVADEVGLGKTMVARGVIARALEHLHDRVERIDVVYVCSNAAIAAQNINRLNVVGQREFALASRLTLLPTKVQELSKNPINFVSFTPGTTFDLKSSGGVMMERALVYRMLRDEPWLRPGGLLNALQCTAGEDNWKRCAKDWEIPFDEALAEKYRAAVRGDPALRARVVEISERFHRHRQQVPYADSAARYALVGDLRHRLAATCLHALEPDLVILDEFQRFRDLLDGGDEAATLARDLFSYPGVRVLLLSATPYKMLALDHEREDDHYPDFLRTLGFLLEDPAEVESIQSDIQRFRRALYTLAAGDDSEVAAARAALEARLRRVMCRTERVAMTARRDAMLAEPARPARLEPADLEQAALADRAVRALDAGDAIEYWKSSPYLLSFLRHYELRKKLDARREDPPDALLEALREGGPHLLDRERFERYERIDPANARLRVLLADTLDLGLWRVLWMPPSLPYAAPGGAFTGLGEVTKSLVFSAWNAVPDAIAALCSYEAERRAVEGLGGNLSHSTLYDRLKPLLRFTRGRDGRLNGMPALALLVPSPALAAWVDPLRIALEEGDGAPVPVDVLLAAAEAALAPRLAPLLHRASHDASRDGPVDQRWYWAAPVLLDAGAYPGLRAFCAAGASGWIPGEHEEEEEHGDRESGFAAHLHHLVETMEGRLDPPLGRPPEDLARVLAEIALAAPGTCALRALRRAAPGLPPDDASLLGGAAQTAWGFKSLLNLPESIALLRGAEDERYWRLALGHGLDGNLQAVLDEQVHVLQESLGLLDAPPERRAEELGAALAEALGIRTAQLRVDLVHARPRARRVEIDHVNARCRFALRFGDLRDDKDTTLARADTVRSAFNSPFRPFVLATTSIGQEGLDFHTWCHAVVHWNLPANPVDLEQREGRVHRYKGHAVRKNVARLHGLAALRERWDRKGDPWACLFEHAASKRPACASELWPYWVFEVEGGARVERRVPLLPLSREVEQLRRLKRNLALYRLVFGQPRQEDLLAHLAGNLSDAEAERAAAAWAISLMP
ncbi:DEAD/DEAH box helicase [Sorangium sp. So ce1128]